MGCPAAYNTSSHHDAETERAVQCLMPLMHPFSTPVLRPAWDSHINAGTQIHGWPLKAWTKAFSHTAVLPVTSQMNAWQQPSTWTGGFGHILSAAAGAQGQGCQCVASDCSDSLPGIELAHHLHNLRVCKSAYTTGGDGMDAKEIKAANRPHIRVIHPVLPATPPAQVLHQCLVKGAPAAAHFDSLIRALNNIICTATACCPL
jgi:hypothetical protein